MVTFVAIAYFGIAELLALALFSAIRANYSMTRREATSIALSWGIRWPYYLWCVLRAGARELSERYRNRTEELRAKTEGPVGGWFLDDVRPLEPYREGTAFSDHPPGNVL